MAGGDIKNLDTCGKDGCTLLQLLSQAQQGHTEALATISSDLKTYAVEFRAAVAGMNTNLQLQNARLGAGADKFEDIEEDIEELKGLKERVAVLESNAPTKMQSAGWGATAGGGSFLAVKVLGWLIGLFTGG